VISRAPGPPSQSSAQLPSFVRVTDELPKLASMKADKRRLRGDAWRVDGVFWRPAKGERLRLLDDADRERLDPLLGQRDARAVSP
jgi:fatty-acyl-CoA synthase